jgi:hypothetical protein
LEAETEKLSGQLESKGDKDKQKIINATDYVKKRIKNLLEGLAEGEITGGAKTERSYVAAEHEKYEGMLTNSISNVLVLLLTVLFPFQAGSTMLVIDDSLRIV